MPHNLTRVCARAALTGLTLAAAICPAAASAATGAGGASIASPLSSSHTTYAASKTMHVHRSLLGHRMLRLGMRGRDVKQMQRALTIAGYPTSADGQFGPMTRASLILYQRATGLRANGILTRVEARTLRGALRRAHRVTATATTSATTANGTATIASNGQLELPAGAPAAVRQIVAAANSIIDTPYVWGGGHGSFQSSGYDCSGAVSFALHGGGLLSSPEDSTGLESYGQPGKGTWVTVYTNPSHAFLVVDGRAFDTADYSGPNIPSGSGPRWRLNPMGDLQGGGPFIARHPAGL